MGDLTVSEKYAAAYEVLGILALNDGLRPWKRAISRLEDCYVQGRDYMVPVMHLPGDTEELKNLADYMPEPYGEDQKTFRIPWMNDHEAAHYRDLLYGVSVDMEATHINDPVLAMMLLQAEVLKSYGKLAFKPD